MLCTFLVIEMRGHGHHTSRLLQATYKSKIVMWGSSTFTVETNHARAQKSICRDVFDSSSSVWFATCSAHQDHGCQMAYALGYPSSLAYRFECPGHETQALHVNNGRSLHPNVQQQRAKRFCWIK
ncbi:hypothetical protein OPV22_001924 [Ensete ventricosum]|uniref:Uncharacterized protein n=1 Tax=Ensete ventricosum TaxID=4639 RepID=A0AAV8QF24_ENSVE|nr:hypothetical protein OPV22_001924 [Ensete ventricosum]